VTIKDIFGLAIGRPRSLDTSFVLLKALTVHCKLSYCIYSVDYLLISLVLTVVSNLHKYDSNKSTEFLHVKLVVDGACHKVGIRGQVL
jgi:hypothetical protein